MLLNINLGIISITNIDITEILRSIKQIFNRNKNKTITQEYLNKLRNRKSKPVLRRTIYNFDSE